MQSEIAWFVLLKKRRPAPDRTQASNIPNLFVFVGEVFTLPKAKTLETSAIGPGPDGEKMSKSWLSATNTWKRRSAKLLIEGGPLTQSLQGAKVTEVKVMK